MATFNQQGQTVTYQYNADTINFGQIETKAELLTALEALKHEIDLAIKAKALNDEEATDAEYSMKKALQQAQKPDTDKNTLLSHINNAKQLVGGIAGLADAFKAAGDVIAGLF